MVVATKTLPLTPMPIDLAADAEVAARLTAAGKTTLALQNGSSGKLIYIADNVAAAPAAGSREGILLRYGDIAVYDIDDGDQFWIWTTSASASLAITNAGD